VVEQTKQSLEPADSHVQPAVQLPMRRFRPLAEGPEHNQVDCGVELSAQVGAFLVGARFRATSTCQ
jgi:hypothetical protein